MSNINQFIIFKLETEEFGIKIDEVQEIVKPQNITKIPQSAGFVEGIINLREKIIVIIDLRKQLGFEINNNDQHRVIITKINNTDVGFIVDDASEVIKIKTDEIEDPTDKVAGMKTNFLKGIAKVEDRLILLLNHANLLSTAEKTELKEIGEE